MAYTKESYLYQRLKDNKIFNAISRFDLDYILKQGFWTTLDFLSGSLLAFIVQFLVINKLSRENYGIYQYLFALSGVIMSFSLQGLRTAMIRLVSQGKIGAYPATLKFLKKFSLILSLAHIVTGIYFFYSGKKEYAYLIVVIGICAPYITTFNTYTGYLQGTKNFKDCTRYQVIIKLASSLLMLLCIAFTDKLFPLIATSQFATLFGTMYFNRKVEKNISAPPPIEINGDLFGYGTQLSFLGILGSISQYADKIILNGFGGPALVAQLSVSSIVTNRIKVFLKSTSTILLPKLADKKIKEIKNIYYFRTFQSILIGICISAIVYTLSPILIKLFYPKYSDSIFIAQIASLELIFILAGNYHSAILRGQKMVRELYIITTFNGLVRIAGIFIGGYYHGLHGIIFAKVTITAVTFTTGHVIIASYLKRETLVDSLTI